MAHSMAHSTSIPSIYAGYAGKEPEDVSDSDDSSAGEFSPAATQEPRTFHQFSRLPTELRLRIWKGSLTERVVAISRRLHGVNMEVVEQQAESPTALDDCFPRLAEWAMEKRASDQMLEPAEYCIGNERLIQTTTFTSTAVPATLHVNREARMETLKHYELCFELPGGESHVYFNFDLDMLQLPFSRDITRMFQYGELERVQAIRFPEIRPNHATHEDDWLVHHPAFKNKSEEQVKMELQDMWVELTCDFMPQLRKIQLEHYFMNSEYEHPIDLDWRSPPSYSPTEDQYYHVQEMSAPSEWVYPMPGASFDGVFRKGEYEHSRRDMTAFAAMHRIEDPVFIRNEIRRESHRNAKHPVVIEHWLIGKRGTTPVDRYSRHALLNLYFAFMVGERQNRMVAFYF